MILLAAVLQAETLADSLRRFHEQTSYRFEIWRDAKQGGAVLAGWVEGPAAYLRFEKLEILRGPAGTLARLDGGAWTSVADVRTACRDSETRQGWLERLRTVRLPSAWLQQVPGWFSRTEGTLKDGLSGDLSSRGIQQVLAADWVGFFWEKSTLLDARGEWSMQFDAAGLPRLLRLRLEGKLLDERTPPIGSPDEWKAAGGPPKGTDGIPDRFKRRDAGNPLTGLPPASLVLAVSLERTGGTRIPLEDEILRRVGFRRSR